MEILKSNNVNNISGPVSLDILINPNGDQILLFGDIHEDTYLCNNCTKDNNCYEMNDIYEMFNNDNTDIFIELQEKCKPDDILCVGQLKKFACSIDKFNSCKFNIHHIDIRTKETLKCFLNWFDNLKGQDISIDNIQKIFSDSIKYIVYYGIDKSVDLTNSFLNCFTDFLDYFQLSKNKDIILLLIDHIMADQKIIETFNNLYISFNELSENIKYYYSSIILAIIVDIYTIVLIDNSPRNIHIYYAGIAHKNNIYIYLTNTDWIVKSKYEGDRYNKCINF